MPMQYGDEYHYFKGLNSSFGLNNQLSESIIDLRQAQRAASPTPNNAHLSAFYHWANHSLFLQNQDVEDE